MKNKFLPFIRRHSETIWYINDVRMDARRKEVKCWYGGSLRKCLSAYYAARNPKLKRLFIDSLICTMLNHNHEAVFALTHQVAQIKK